MEEEKLIFDEPQNEVPNNSVLTSNPLDNLSDNDLRFLLDHDKEKLTEAQVIEIEARLSRMDETEFTQNLGNLGKSLVLTPAKKKMGRAGYVDVIILMLSTWFTCLLGMAYIYVKLGIMS